MKIRCEQQVFPYWYLSFRNEGVQLTVRSFKITQVNPLETDLLDAYVETFKDFPLKKQVCYSVVNIFFLFVFLYVVIFFS